MTPTLSIVVPSFNQRRYLAVLVEQLAKYRSRGVEVLVLDGGSTDGSRELLEEFSCSIDYWRSEKDAGQAAAVREGMLLARGEWVAFQNSDDLYTDSGLEEVLAAIRCYPSAQLIVGGMHFIDAKGEILRTLTPRPVTLPMMSVRNFLNNQSLFVRRDYLYTIGPVDPTYRFCLDYEWFLRLLKPNPLVLYSDKVLGCQRLHDETKTTTMQDVHDQEFAAARNRHVALRVQRWAVIGYPFYRLYRIALKLWPRRGLQLKRGLRDVRS